MNCIVEHVTTVMEVSLTLQNFTASIRRGSLGVYQQGCAVNQRDDLYCSCSLLTFTGIKIKIVQFFDLVGMVRKINNSDVSLQDSIVGPEACKSVL